MKSNPPAPTSGSSVRAQNSRTFGSIAFIFFGVNTRRQQAAVHVVDRRVLEEDDARRDLDVGLDQLEDRAPAGAGTSPSRRAPRSTSSKRLSAKKSYFSL